MELALVNLKREIEKTNILLNEILDELKKMNRKGETPDSSMVAKAMIGIIEKQNEINGGGNG